MIKRGEIYFVDLDPVQGREQGGYRPVVVLSTDYVNGLPLVVTVVIGTKGANVTKNYRTIVRVPSSESGLPMETVFLCFQVRSIDECRFLDPPAGKLSRPYMRKLEDTVRDCLGL